MDQRVRLASTSLLTLAVALAFAAPAAAQSSPPGTADPASTQSQQATPTTSATVAQEPTTDGQVQDIIVTAQRREESLSRVGISVDVVGAGELQSRDITSPTDLVRVIPGFQAAATPNGNPVYTLRGVGFNTPNASATSPVGIYVNEAAVAYPYMSLGLLYDLERVEALKGPQGTLYGRNATGGLINFVTAKPTDTAKGGFGAEVGSYHTLNVNGFASGPVNDVLRLRFAFESLNRSEGYQRSITSGERIGTLYQKATRLTADVGSGGPFSATFVGDYWKRDGDGRASQSIIYLPLTNPATLPFADPVALASLQPNPTRNQDVDFLSARRQPQAAQGIYQPGPLTDSAFYSGSAKLGFAFSPSMRLQSLTSYQHLRQRDAASDGLQTESTLFDNRNTISSFAQELRLIGEYDRFNWSVGGYFADDRVDALEKGYIAELPLIERLRAIALLVPHPNYTNAQILSSFGNFRDVAHNHSNVYAGFANAEYKISDLLKVTLGGRYTKDKTNFSGCTYDTNGGNLAVINTIYPLFGIKTQLNANECYTLNRTSTDFIRTTITNRINQHNFTWRANVDVTPSRVTLLYGSVSRGYKSGGFPVISASNEIQFDPIQQEQLTAYEVGAKLGLLNRRVQLNAAMFYYDYVNKQIYGRVVDPIFTSLSRIRNIPKSREYGVEGEITWRVTSAVTAHVSGTYLNSKILRFVDINQLGQPQDFRGSPFPYTPKFQGVGSLNYDRPVMGDVHFIADGDVSYQTKSQADAAGLAATSVKAYALVDGSVGIRSADNSWRLQFYVKNLLDTYYWTAVAIGADSVDRSPGMPRELGVRTAFRF